MSPTAGGRSERPEAADRSWELHQLRADRRHRRANHWLPQARPRGEVRRARGAVGGEVPARQLGEGSLAARAVRLRHPVVQEHEAVVATHARTGTDDPQAPRRDRADAAVPVRPVPRARPRSPAARGSAAAPSGRRASALRITATPRAHVASSRPRFLRRLAPNWIDARGRRHRAASARQSARTEMQRAAHQPGAHHRALRPRRRDPPRRPSARRCARAPGDAPHRRPAPGARTSRARPHATSALQPRVVGEVLRAQTSKTQVQQRGVGHRRSEEVGHPGQAAGDQPVHCRHRVTRRPRAARAGRRPARAARSSTTPRAPRCRTESRRFRPGSTRADPPSTSSTRRSTPVTGSVTSSSTRPAARAGQPRAVIAASTSTMRCIQQRNPCTSTARCGSGSSQCSGDASTSAECTNTTSLLCDSWPPRNPSRPRRASSVVEMNSWTRRRIQPPAWRSDFVAHVAGEPVSLVPAVFETRRLRVARIPLARTRNQSGRSSGPSQLNEVGPAQGFDGGAVGLLRTLPDPPKSPSAPRSGRSAGASVQHTSQPQRR